LNTQVLVRDGTLNKSASLCFGFYRHSVKKGFATRYLSLPEMRRIRAIASAGARRCSIVAALRERNRRRPARPQPRPCEL